MVLDAGLPLFIVNLVIYKCKNRLGLAGGPSVWEIAVYLAVAGDVFDGVFFVLSFFPQRCLG